MLYYDTLIREYHLDSFGHVNNAMYLQIYEEARWEVITQNGYGYKEVHALKQGPIILELNIKFIKELKLRDAIRVTVETVSYPGKTGQLKQQMIKNDGLVASELLVTFGLFDMVQRRLIEATPAWRKAIGV